MKLYLFNKGIPHEGPAALIARAQQLGLAGYHLCVRPGYILTPENVAAELPRVMRELRKAGLEVPMLTTRADLNSPDDPGVKPLLRSMAESEVRLLKIGYFRVPRASPLHFESAVNDARVKMKRWQALGREYGVRICCHNHASCGDYFIGSNTSALWHLLSEFDPAAVGIYLDTAHLAVEGEPFDLAVAIARPLLAGLALKDAAWVRENDGLSPALHWKRAGQGTVDWAIVRDVFARERFALPVTVHAEYQADTPAAYLDQLPREVTYFSSLLAHG